MKETNLSLAQETIAALEEIAQQTGRSRNKLIKTALDRHGQQRSLRLIPTR